jgi:hypothetical protein
VGDILGDIRIVPAPALQAITGLEMDMSSMGILLGFAKDSAE